MLLEGDKVRIKESPFYQRTGIVIQIGGNWTEKEGSTKVRIDNWTKEDKKRYPLHYIGLVRFHEYQLEKIERGKMKRKREIIKQKKGGE